MSSSIMMSTFNISYLMSETSWKIIYVLAFLGTFHIFYFFKSAIEFLLFHTTVPTKPLKSYRRTSSKPAYALVTGGNGGIGYGIALSLVKNSFGVIILGRDHARLAVSAEKLREAVILPCYKGGTPMTAAQRAERDTYVKTIVLDPQIACSGEIERAVREEVVEKGLCVTILVNNVGSVPIDWPPYRRLATYSPEDINKTINLNVRFMAHLTMHMLPILGSELKDGDIGQGQRRRTRSLILNLSSGAKIGLPYQIIYSSTKAFNSTFSIGLSRELKDDPELNHIDVLAITAGDVRSQNNIAGLTKGSPDSEAYGRYIVEKCDGAIRRGWREMTPYWSHHLDFIMLSFTPDRLVDKGLSDIMLGKLHAMNEATRRKGV